MTDVRARQSELQATFEAYIDAGLKLDLTRGKPAAEQLDLSNDLDGILGGDYLSLDGTDVRNYGGILGIPEARQLGAEFMGVKPEQVMVGGNSSLNLMYQYVEHMMAHWGDEPVKFLLGEKVLKGLLQAASVMGLPEVIVQGDGENIKVLATNSKNTTSHQFSYEVGKTSDHFKMVFKVENLKLIAGTYDVSISSSRIAKFILQDQSLSYWIATEGTSTYGN